MNLMAIDYGVGNTKSVQFAGNRLGYHPILMNNSNMSQALGKIVFLGVDSVFKLKTNLFRGLKNDAYMYLVHSYYAELCEDTISETNYSVTYSSA